MRWQRRDGWVILGPTPMRNCYRKWIRRLIVLLGLALLVGLAAFQADAATAPTRDPIALGRDFGVIIGPVTEDVRKELNMRTASGVVVYEIIGSSLADLAGIKVHAVIAEISSKPVQNLNDFGRLLSAALKEGNFTIGTWEPTSPENQGQGQQMNFHFVPNRLD